MIIPREKIKSQIAEALDIYGCKDVIIHTDISMIGVPGPVSGGGRNGIGGIWLSLFEEIAEGRVIRFPTFNYDYCGKRVYDVERDPCQVGALNDFVRRAHPERRTHTPVFNFCALGEYQRQSLAGSVNPFGADSTFAEFVGSSGWSASLGRDLQIFTFMHYAEELMNVGYRYLKPFPGIRRVSSGDERVDFLFRCHPPDDLTTVDLDIERVERDLSLNGILFSYKVGMGNILLRDAKKATDFWCDRIDSDPFYLLTQDSRERIKEKSRIWGYPFTYESVEGVS